MEKYLKPLVEFAIDNPMPTFVALALGLIAVIFIYRLAIGWFFGMFGLSPFLGRGLVAIYFFPAVIGTALWHFAEKGNIPYVSPAIRFFKRVFGDAEPVENIGAVDPGADWIVPVVAGIAAFFIFVICAMFFLSKHNKQRNPHVNYLVLLRHGQSQWNLENRFTGFHDIDLSDLGREEAAGAGKRLKALGVTFDAVYTSTLQRAYNTAQIALTNAGQEDMIPKIVRHDDLRERDYGDLTGLNKDETRAKYGEEQVHIWRRSYDVCPPGGECLKDVVENRVRPYYAANIAQQLLDGKNVLVAAHGNSLRALLIILGAETPETINAAEMETGVPVVFEMDKGKILKRYSLTDAKTAA